MPDLQAIGSDGKFVWLHVKYDPSSTKRSFGLEYLGLKNIQNKKKNAFS